MPIFRHNQNNNCNISSLVTARDFNYCLVKTMTNGSDFKDCINCRLQIKLSQMQASNRAFTDPHPGPGYLFYLALAFWNILWLAKIVLIISDF